MCYQDCSASRVLPLILSAPKLLVLHDLPDEAKTVFKRSNKRKLICTKSKTIYLDSLPFLLEGPAGLHFQGNQWHQVGHHILGNQALPVKSSWAQCWRGWSSNRPTPQVHQSVHRSWLWSRMNTSCSAASNHLFTPQTGTWVVHSIWHQLHLICLPHFSAALS